MSHPLCRTHGLAACPTCTTIDDYARSFEPLGPEPCPHPKDALGCCTGPCAGEDWER